MTNNPKAQEVTQEQMDKANRKLSDMNDNEFSKEFDELTPEQTKKLLEKMQKNSKNGDNE